MQVVRRQQQQGAWSSQLRQDSLQILLKALARMRFLRYVCRYLTIPGLHSLLPCCPSVGSSNRAPTLHMQQIQGCAHLHLQHV